jgi:hypothetical protein
MTSLSKGESRDNLYNINLRNKDSLKESVQNDILCHVWMIYNYTKNLVRGKYLIYAEVKRL